MLHIRLLRVQTYEGGADSLCNGIGQFARPTGYWCATCFFQTTVAAQTARALQDRKLCKVERCGHARRREKRYEDYCKQCSSDKHKEQWQWCSSCTKRVAVPERKHGQCLDCVTTTPRPSKTCIHRLQEQHAVCVPRTCQVQLLDAADSRSMLLGQRLGVRPASSKMIWATSPA